MRSAALEDQRITLPFHVCRKLIAFAILRLFLFDVGLPDNTVSSDGGGDGHGY